ncbi:winged helix-turn-helix transcriptional regulator [Pectinatus brassicae]|uniref:DNA-binding HxlR family transcriptional regulator n=1 Tax=Pectinatus brassicae TaxID=862415 RepID=A0A840UIF3_9FIRM|nr:helix-turn-helix domain-containing protein [Pectinatus brassicae]MBB5336769.1 DNA-binding HxlR family transcriptional regulator [Pectinatus brassicae]
MKNKNLFGTCPYFTAQKILVGKWSLLILHYLDGEVLRFKQLERLLAPIAQTTLTKQLRGLEEHGLIERKVYTQIPPRVEYSLTQVGREFKPVLEKLELWGEIYIKYLENKNKT